MLEKKELVDFILEQFKLDRDYLNDDLPLFSSSLLDSTNLIAVIMFIEARTGVSIDNGDLTLDHFDTISAILSFCHARLDCRGGP